MRSTGDSNRHGGFIDRRASGHPEDSRPEGKGREPHLDPSRIGAAASRPLYEANAYSCGLPAGVSFSAKDTSTKPMSPNIAEEIKSSAPQQTVDPAQLRGPGSIQHMLEMGLSAGTADAAAGAPRSRSIACMPGSNSPRIRASRSQLPAILTEAYELGIAFAMDETDLERTAFPARCPYDWDDRR